MFELQFGMNGFKSIYSHYLESGCYLLFSDFVFKDTSRNACSNGNGYMKW